MTDDARIIATLNTGSSSIKLGLFELGQGQDPILSATGKIERIGLEPALTMRESSGEVLVRRQWPNGAAMTHADLLQDLLEWLGQHLAGRRLAGVGHRVVHGGLTFGAPCRIDDQVLAALEALSPLAPLHQPANLAGVRAVKSLMPQTPQIACFDTAFHRTMPDAASRFALPRRFHEDGVRRYGFHGLSYEYIARRLKDIDPALAAGRVIVAHLGSGASLCAMKGGVSVDTTMGFSALDGLVMGTRCGTLDPGVVLHLQAAYDLPLKDIDDLLYRRSGLLGVSGVSSDMRELLAEPSLETQQAIDLFCQRAAQSIAGLATSLGGIDALVFTAGIGENAAEIRRRICERLGWIGVDIDAGANDERSARLVSTSLSRVSVWVIRTDEEAMIAHHTVRVLAGGGPP